MNKSSQTKLTSEDRQGRLSKQNQWKTAPGIVVSLLLICASGILIYSNSFEAAFQFDDISNIIHNKPFPGLTDWKAWWQYSHTRLTAFYSFALNIHFHGYDVWGFHVVNLLIHLITSCLVWWLTILIFSSPVIQDKAIAKHKYQIALLCGLLFVSHPLATQSVTYIVQRMASMVAMFYIGTIAFYLKARLTPKQGIIQYLLYLMSLFSLVLAFMTKQNAFTLPISILLAEYYFFGSINFNVRKVLNFKSLFFVAGVVAIVIFGFNSFSINFFKPLLPIQGQTETITVSTYLLTQFSVLLKYIQLLILPVNQMLDYDFRLARHFFEMRTLLDFSFLLLIMYAGIRLFQTNRPASFGIFWFFLTISIESSIIPIRDVLFEHRTYLPSFGFFLFVCSMVFDIKKESSRNIGIAVLSIVILSNSYLSYQRNKVWKDPISLWQDNVQKAPNLSRPLCNLAHAHALRSNYPKALELLNKAIAISPNYTNAYFDRGVVQGHLAEYDKAIEDYTKTLELKADYADAYLNRGAAYAIRQQWEQAIQDYTHAIKFKPGNAIAYLNRGSLYSQLQQWLPALEDFNKAIELDSIFVEAYDRRGQLYDILRNWDDAIADWSMAIKIQPDFLEAYMRRAKAYQQSGRYQFALDDYTVVLSLNPSHQEAIRYRDLCLKLVETSQ